MKLIIDVPEIFYRNEKENKGYVSDLKRDIVWDAMIKGTPLVDQEPVLDKIRAEIERITDTMGVSYNQYVSKIDVLHILDKYKAETEET